MGLGFTYLLPPNCLFVPSGSNAASGVFQYLHEIGHAQLSNTLMGLTLQVVHKLEAIAQKCFFPLLASFLRESIKASPSGDEIYKDLFLFGSLHDRPVSLLTTALRDDTVSRWRKLNLDSSFARAVAVFRILNERRRQVYHRWERTHEGLATYHSITVASGESDCALDHIERALEAIGSRHDDLRVDHVRSELPKLAELELQRLNIVRNSRNAIGFRLLRDVGDHCGRASAAWLAATASSHFPYHRCDFLDMPDNVFRAAVEAGYLNLDNRLETIARHPDLVTAVLDERRHRRELLAICCPEALEAPLSEGAVLYGAWQRAYLWDSTLIQGLLGEQITTGLTQEVFEMLKKFDDDARDDFRIRDRNYPTVLFDDGTYCQPDAKRRTAFINNFVDSYEVYRTSELLTTLGGLDDSVH